MAILLVATMNSGKLDEFTSMLTGIDVEIVCLPDLKDEVAEVDETGATFDENARLKASGYAQRTRLHTLADDSGLEVAALGGRPGVLSARYGGENKTSTEKMEVLLNELRLSGGADRSARFVCSLAFAEPTGRILFEARGICTGRISRRPRGEGGFGYDPIFVPEGFAETFGQLPAAVKQSVGHRGRALAQIVPFLRRFYAVAT